MPERNSEQRIAEQKIQRIPTRTEQEQTAETYAEQPRGTSEAASLDQARPQTVTQVTAVPAQASDSADKKELKVIENILAEGLDDFFLSLPNDKQQEFKQSGEQTARTILDVVRRGTTRIKDIVQLIVNWLKTLPGINRFFLEQEAKIKADKIAQRYRS